MVVLVIQIGDKHFKFSLSSSTRMSCPLSSIIFLWPLSLPLSLSPNFPHSFTSYCPPSVPPFLFFFFSSLFFSLVLGLKFFSLPLVLYDIRGSHLRLERHDLLNGIRVVEGLDTVKQNEKRRLFESLVVNKP